MSHTVYRQKKVKIPISQQQYFVQSLSKVDRVTLPTGCPPLHTPSSFSDEMFRGTERMPVVFKKFPFAFSVEHSKRDKIQKILEYSLKQQKEEEVSFTPGFVCCVVKSCLNAINVPCSLEVGYRHLRGGKNLHVWLNIENNKVDNAYQVYMRKSDLAHLEEATPSSYKEETFSYPTKNKIPTDKDGFSELCLKKGLDIFLKEPDKGLALNLNREQLYVYYFSMIQFMWEEFGLSIPGIHPAVRHYCWSCGMFPAHSMELLTDILLDNYVEMKPTPSETRHRFKHCSQCMVAKYCSVKCQEKDWEEQHRFLCVSRVDGANSDF